MEKEYFLIRLDNVLKGDYCESDTYLDNVLNDIKFPILAEKTNIEGVYKDLITQELIYDIEYFPPSEKLHCKGAIKVDARFCQFYLKKLGKRSIARYIEIMKEIKAYTIKEAKINKQVQKITRKSKVYVNSFIRKNSKKR